MTTTLAPDDLQRRVYLTACGDLLQASCLWNADLLGLYRLQLTVRTGMYRSGIESSNHARREEFSNVLR